MKKRTGTLLVTVLLAGLSWGQSIDRDAALLNLMLQSARVGIIPVGEQWGGPEMQTLDMLLQDYPPGPGEGPYTNPPPELGPEYCSVNVTGVQPRNHVANAYVTGICGIDHNSGWDYTNKITICRGDNVHVEMVSDSPRWYGTYNLTNTPILVFAALSNTVEVSTEWYYLPPKTYKARVNAGMICTSNLVCLWLRGLSGHTSPIVGPPFVTPTNSIIEPPRLKPGGGFELQLPGYLNNRTVEIWWNDDLAQDWLLYTNQTVTTTNWVVPIPPMTNTPALYFWPVVYEEE